MKESYKKLSEKMENKKKMEDIYLKLDYEKNLLVFDNFFFYFLIFLFFINRPKRKKSLRNTKQEKFINFLRSEKDKSFLNNFGFKTKFSFK